MNIAWATDIHFNFEDDSHRRALYDEIIAAQCDAVLITGDIGEAQNFDTYLRLIHSKTGKQLYYVLGNHDFYTKSRLYSHTKATGLAVKSQNNIRWLGWDRKAIQLTPECYLVGVDGWADGRYGDYKYSTITMSDSIYIADLAGSETRAELLQSMQQLADQDADKLKSQLEAAISHNATQIIVATHVPPFAAICRHRGNETDPEVLPFYSSKALGDVILDAATQHPQITFKTYSGHTHGACKLQLKENLYCSVGAAEYYIPQLVEVIEV